ncbi:hypothetical protein [Aquimarina aquimarini]|uniref:hypothetical protein n=1 Tax=Aquimarina aquimarini TaxID=1191734 RepID=UPI00131F2B54|nr:hypothetical protein [Aquimarina aquimarini]
MTEEKLYERLMDHKSKYGVTQEVWQHYKWALELLRQQHQKKQCTTKKKKH